MYHFPLLSIKKDDNWRPLVRSGAEKKKKYVVKIRYTNKQIQTDVVASTIKSSQTLAYGNSNNGILGTVYIFDGIQYLTEIKMFKTK